MTNPEASIQHFDRVSQSHPEAFTSNFFEYDAYSPSLSCAICAGLGFDIKMCLFKA